MYAIRSYYECGFDTGDRRPFPQWRVRRAFQNKKPRLFPPAAAARTHPGKRAARITSYNVCYTKLLRNGNFNNSIKSIYNCDDSQLSFYQQRFEKLIDMYGSQFGEANEIRLFSAPGRTEIAGNHTDHQHGHVMAASVNLDVIAAVSLNNSDEIRIKSEGYNMDIINIRELEKNESEYNKAIALIRGVVARFKGMGYEIKGFNAYTTSNVLKGRITSYNVCYTKLLRILM